MGNSMTPERIQELIAELADLSRLHRRATVDAQFVSMSSEDAVAYDERRKRMDHIRREISLQ
jgi:hypothetical protein